jgi:hypothetical protein
MLLYCAVQLLANSGLHNAVVRMLCNTIVGCCVLTCLLRIALYTATAWYNIRAIQARPVTSLHAESTRTTPY